MKDYGKITQVIVWGVLTALLAMCFYSATSKFVSAEISAVVLAPILEETLKFISVRATQRPLYVGITVQILEGISYGITNLAKIVTSPHLLTVVFYYRYGASWKVLPFAILTHFLWNAYWQYSAPWDALALAGLSVMIGIALFAVRTRDEVTA